MTEDRNNRPESPATKSGLRAWVGLALEHFWKIIVVLVIVLWVLGYLPMPEPKELLDFIRAMKD